MALAVRFQAAANATIRHHSGKVYSANSSGIADIPVEHADGIHGQGQRLGYVGATADRPKADGRANWPPSQMVDLTLNKQIFWTGSGWIDASGAAV
jgi:hypothetical protein